MSNIEFNLDCRVACCPYYFPWCIRRKKSPGVIKIPFIPYNNTSSVWQGA